MRFNLYRTLFHFSHFDLLNFGYHVWRQDFEAELEIVKESLQDVPKRYKLDSIKSEHKDIQHPGHEPDYCRVFGL